MSEKKSMIIRKLRTWEEDPGCREEKTNLLFRKMIGQLSHPEHFQIWRFYVPTTINSEVLKKWNSNNWGQIGTHFEKAVQAYIIKGSISPKPLLIKTALLSFSRILSMTIKESLIENLSLFHHNQVTLPSFSK